jgi:hypothetical protein
MGLRARLVEGFLKHRTQLARVVALVGILVIAAQFLPVVPREVELRYDLGPAHASVRGLELVYQAGDEDLASARFGFGEEGPRLVEHRVDLPPGHYDVRATLDTPQGNLRFIRTSRRRPTGWCGSSCSTWPWRGPRPPGVGCPRYRVTLAPLNPTACQTSLAWHPHSAVLVWHSVPFSADGAVFPP